MSSTSFERMESTTSESYFFPTKDNPRFLITLEVGKYRVDFTVLECVHIPEFLDDGTVAWGWKTVGKDLVPLPQSEESTEPYLRGFIKWDECSHFWFGDEKIPGYLHLCGTEDIEQFAALMAHLHEECMSHMSNIL